MLCEELKSRKNFVEEDFIELRDSVEGLISVIEKYKDMRYNSSTYIDDLKDFLADIKLTLKEKKITDRELKNLNFLREDYFRTYGDSIYEYYVYDKNERLVKRNLNELIYVIDTDEIDLKKEKEINNILYSLFPPRGGLTEMYVADDDREKMNKINDELGELKKKLANYELI